MSNVFTQEELKDQEIGKIRLTVYRTLVEAGLITFEDRPSDVTLYLDCASTILGCNCQKCDTLKHEGLN